MTWTALLAGEMKSLDSQIFWDKLRDEGILPPKQTEFGASLLLRMRGIQMILPYNKMLCIRKLLHNMSANVPKSIIMPLSQVQFSSPCCLSQC